MADLYGNIKVYVPKENCMVVLALAGVQCPNAPRGDSKGEPFGAEALAFSKDRLHQRDVRGSRVLSR